MSLKGCVGKLRYFRREIETFFKVLVKIVNLVRNKKLTNCSFECRDFGNFSYFGKSGFVLEKNCTIFINLSNEKIVYLLL